MISSSLVLVSLVLGLAPVADTHTIKIKKSAKGDVTKVEDVDESTTAVVATDGAGTKLVDQKEKTSKTNIYQETILEKKEGDDKSTSIKRAYEKARNLPKDGKEETRVYEGKTVLIDKKGDKYQFMIEGGKEITAKEAEDLDKSFNKKGPTDEEMEQYLLPGKAVKVGESWKIDADKMLKELMKDEKETVIAFDSAKTEASGKLLEVYEKNGHKFGKMTFAISATLKEFSAGGMKFKVRDGSKMAMDIQFDVCIDGGEGSGVLKMEMKMTLNADLPTPDGKEVNMMVDGKSTMTRKITDVTKK
jgi:hypothetical protein